MLSRMGDAELRNLELRLRMELDHALQASIDLDRARAQRGLGPLPPLNIAHREALATARETTVNLIHDAAQVRRGLAVDVADAAAQRLRLIKDSNK
jgi:hypothetical protein